MKEPFLQGTTTVAFAFLSWLHGATMSPAIGAAKAMLCKAAGKVYVKQAGDGWTLFDATTAHRLTIGTVPARALHLADIKITDYCERDCEFCYQSSGKNGSHATVASVREALDALAASGCFEVAIGGGEPFTHPSLVEICEAARLRRIMPNVSSGLYASDLTHHKAYSAVKQLCGGVAVSVDDWARLDDALRAGIRHLHIIPEAATDYRALFSELRWRGRGCTVVLLGWKDCGKAETLSPKPLGADFVDECDALSRRGVSVAMDTVMAARFADDLRAAGVPASRFSVRDFETSMYVDLVAGKIAESSYGGRSEYIGFNLQGQVARFFASGDAA